MSSDEDSFHSADEAVNDKKEESIDDVKQDDVKEALAKENQEGSNHEPDEVPQDKKDAIDDVLDKKEGIDDMREDDKEEMDIKEEPVVVQSEAPPPVRPSSLAQRKRRKEKPEKPTMRATKMETVLSPEEDMVTPCEQMAEEKTDDPPVEEHKESSLWSSFVGAASSLTTSMGDGLTDVLESMNIPSPEQLARLPLDERRRLEDKADVVKEQWPCTDHDDCESAAEEEEEEEQQSYAHRLFGGVAATGSQLVGGSLDVLESVGRRTFGALTVRDERGEGHRFVLAGERGATLSDVLREMKDRPSEAISSSSPSAVYGRTFDRFGGLAQLDGLEMLSRSFGGDENGVDGDLAVLHHEEEGGEESPADRLRCAIQSTSLPYDVQPLIEVIVIDYTSVTMQTYTRLCHVSKEGEEEGKEKMDMKAMEALAEMTANCVHCLHKCAQLLLLARPPPSHECMAAVTRCLLGTLSRVTTEYARQLNESKEGTDATITAVYMEGANSGEYVKHAHGLLLVVLRHCAAVNTP